MPLELKILFLSSEYCLKARFKYLDDGGSLRIAVPDGNNPNKEYRNHCGINGIGADASDHKQFITFELLSNEIQKIGFKFILKEGYLQNGELITEKLNEELGIIIRSRSNKINMKSKEGWSFHDANTSLIIDCFKKTLRYSLSP